MKPLLQNYRIQRWVVITALLLFIIKLVAYFLTKSVSILTDALESTVNVVAGVIGLYSLYVSAKPSDHDHPYGHGKVEFLSAAVEGTLVLIAGLLIIYEAVQHFVYPHEIKQLSNGILLIAGTAIVNYLLGWFVVKKGKQNNSPALIASGKHLQSDTYSSVGIILGLILIKCTGLYWIDSVVALFFAFIILYTGYTIVRSSIAGIMDEADTALLSKMITLLNNNRRENWVDLHNLRVIKYGGQLHIDCHLTVPWYLNVHEAHQEIDALTALIKKELGDTIEFFVHSDGCLDFSCSICTKAACPHRKNNYEQTITWTIENILSNKKHRMPK